MNQSVTQQETDEASERRRIVQELLAWPGANALDRDARPAVARRIQILERQSPELIERARDAGVDIEFLGFSPLFVQPRLYRGVDSDWVLGPATDPEDAVVPRQERDALERLVAAGAQFPLTYVAHEVRKDRTEDLVADGTQGHRVLDWARATELVGPVPPPLGSARLGERLAGHSTTLLRAAKRGAQVAGATAAAAVVAPVVLVGGALAALSSTVDPIVLGAIPAIRAADGEPAAWYVLVRWDW